MKQVIIKVGLFLATIATAVPFTRHTAQGQGLTEPSAVAEGVLPFGDVNNDGEITIVDALKIAQYYVGLYPQQYLYMMTADVNADLTVDIVDALTLAQRYVGLITDLKIESTPYPFQASESLLADAAEAALGKPSEEITYADLRRIRSIVVECSPSVKEEVDLTAISHMLGLSSLRINHCTLSDLSPLSDMISKQAPLRVADTPSDPSSPSWYSHLLSIDLKGCEILNYDSLMTLSFGISLAIDRVQCEPKDLIGDLNGDDLITEGDPALAEALLQPRASFYKLLLSDNIGCVDINKDNRVTEADAVMIEAVLQGTMSSPGRLGITCNENSIKGDADGDGEITEDDANLVADLYMGRVSVSDNICCVDVDGVPGIGFQDISTTAQMAMDENLIPEMCGDQSSGIGIITYDLRWPGFITEALGHEPANIPLEVIHDLHDRIMSNPFMAKADVVLLPEFAYSNRMNPVRLAYDNTTEDGDKADVFDLDNSNAVVDLIKELQASAAQEEVSLFVPLAEITTIKDDNEQDCTAFWNSAIVIDIEGDIKHVFRKQSFDLECTVSNEKIAELNQIARDTLGKLELKTRSGQTFTTVMVICADFGEAGVMSKLSTLGDADLFMYSAGMPDNTFNADEIMRRIQFFDESSAHEGIYRLSQSLDDLTDNYKYLVHAGLGAIPDHFAQGVFDTTHEIPQPLPYIFTQQFYDGGYIYARVVLGN